MENDLINLQTKLAHQENTLDALNEVVVRQQQQIDALEKLCAELRDKLLSLSDTAGTVGGEDAPPPHY